MIDQVLQEEYKYHHQDLECDGIWKRDNIDLVYNYEGKFIDLINAPVIICRTCGSLYLKKDFELRVVMKFEERLKENPELKNHKRWQYIHSDQIRGGLDPLI